MMLTVRRLVISGLIFLSFPVFSIDTPVSADSPYSADSSAAAKSLLWQRALGGSIDAFPAQGPGGDLYIIADDRALHSIDPLSGASKWIYRPGGRLRNWLMVAPDGTIYVQNDREELYAVTPGGTGRWKLKMNGEPAALPAAGPDGRVVLPLAGGRVVCLSRRGYIIWQTELGAEAASGPVINADGNAWIPLSDGRIVVLTPEGKQIGETAAGAAITALALDGVGRLWAGSLYGRVTAYNSSAPLEISFGTPMKVEIEHRLGDSRVVSIITGAEGDAEVFLADGSLISILSDGDLGSRRKIGNVGGAPSVDVNGTLYLPLADGSIRVLSLLGEESELKGRALLAEPLITREGVLVAGGSDWMLYAWRAATPGEGWRQFRGGPMRSGTLGSERKSYNRNEARKEAGFFYREKMAGSEDLDERLVLLDELESYPDDRAMFDALPWVDLLLEDLASAGTIRRVGIAESTILSHPRSRARAYLLLARGEDFRNRGFLLECLRHENDSHAMAAGFRALGHIGTDWDGASMRMIASRYRSIIQPDEKLTLETSRAIGELVRYNGALTDPVGYSLFDRMLNSSLSSSAREEVLAAIRLIAGL